MFTVTLVVSQAVVVLVIAVLVVVGLVLVVSLVVSVETVVLCVVVSQSFGEAANCVIFKARLFRS